MKKKNISLKKLFLNKEKVTELSNDDQNIIKGGATEPLMCLTIEGSCIQTRCNCIPVTFNPAQCTVTQPVSNCTC